MSSTTTKTVNRPSHAARPVKPRLPIQSAYAPTKYWLHTAPKTPSMFIRPNSEPVCRPLTLVAQLHQLGSIKNEHRHEQAASSAAPVLQLQKTDRPRNRAAREKQGAPSRRRGGSGWMKVL